MITINRYYKSQKALIEALNSVIDNYWGGKINEEDMISIVNDIINKNRDKVFTQDNQYSATVLQRCGKGRIDLIEKVRRKL